MAGELSAKVDKVEHYDISGVYKYIKKHHMLNLYNINPMSASFSCDASIGGDLAEWAAHPL